MTSTPATSPATSRPPPRASRGATLRAIVVCAGFAVIGLFPLLQRLSKFLPDTPLNENRQPKPWPEWKGLEKLEAYLSGFQGWFNDRYAGRNLLIRFKTQIDYSCFAYSDRIYVGRDGWLFYRSVLDDQVQAERALRPQDLDYFPKAFRQLNDWLAPRNITLVIVVPQMKYAFYPEMLPPGASRFPAASKFDELRRRLRDESGARYVDSTAILHALKAQREIFHRTDFHWNDPAAFAVAEEVVAQFAQGVGRPDFKYRFPLETERRPSSGGEAAFMPMLRPVGEQALFVKPTWTEHPVESPANPKPYEMVRRMQPVPPDVLPPVVVFGDSFFDGMYRSGFAEHFAAIHRSRIHHTTLQETLARMPADTRCVLIEFIEPAINVFATPLDYAALDQAFPKPNAASP